MSTRYRVKWTDKDKVTHYGVVIDRIPWNKDQYQGIPEDVTLVSDALLPTYHNVPTADLVDVPFQYNNTRDEYDKYVENAYEQARKISDKVGDHVAPGAMFDFVVGDGKAYYVVTKVAGCKCDVEWRGYSGEVGYTNHYFGWGRKGVPVSDIAPYIHRSVGIRAIFGESKRGRR